MITKRTVLILGAGASADYGFPTGRELLFKVCRLLQERAGLYRYLQDQMSIASSDITNFGDALAKSSAPSVDLFLEKNPEFERVGKLVIALELIQLERPDELQPKLEKRWYETLFHLMVQDGAFEDSKLSIVTFIMIDRWRRIFSMRSRTYIV